MNSISSLARRIAVDGHTPARVALGALLGLALLDAPAAAQFGFPSPDEPDGVVDATVRAATVNALADSVERLYVFPDVAKRTATALRGRLKQGSYDRITSAKAFAESLSTDLVRVGHDGHFHVGYYDRELAPDAFSQHGPSPVERARALEESRRRNFGFEQLRRLPGNIGYLELRLFDGSPEGGALAQAAMTMLNGSDALIIDLRRCIGGDSNMIVLILSWLFPADQPVHINDFYYRDVDRTEQTWTLTTLPGPRYLGKEVYVLTGPGTASAGEEFAYDLKNLKRATLVGQSTAGGANPGEFVRVGPHFAAFVSNGRAINPISKTNWEGVGVEPDLKTPVDDALKTAQVAALTSMLAKASDPELKAGLERALQLAKSVSSEAGGSGPQHVMSGAR